MSFRHTRFPPRPALTLNDLQRWLSSSLIVAICAGHLLIESIRYETNRPNSALGCGVPVLGFFGRGGELLLGFLQSVSESADSLAEALAPLGQPLRPKHKQRNHEDDNQVRGLK